MTMPGCANGVHFRNVAISDLTKHEFVFIPGKGSITIVTAIALSQKRSRFITGGSHSRHCSASVPYHDTRERVVIFVPFEDNCSSEPQSDRPCQ